MYVVFDTETTGLPQLNWTDWSECHMIQIGWLVVDEHFQVISSKSRLIRNGGLYNSTPDALAIHHITDEFREENGAPFAAVMNEFLNDCKECKRIVCHGATFDVELLIHECRIYDIDISELNGVVVYDTKYSKHYVNKGMNLSTTIKTISPTFTVSLKDKSAHDALYDAYLCLELFRKTSDHVRLANKFDVYVKKCQP